MTAPDTAPLAAHGLADEIDRRIASMKRECPNAPYVPVPVELAISTSAALRRPTPPSDVAKLREALELARKTLIEVGVSHNTFLTVLDHGGDGPRKQYRLQAPLGHEAVQYALRTANAAADAMTAIDAALASQDAPSGDTRAALKGEKT